MYEFIPLDITNLELLRKKKNIRKTFLKHRVFLCRKVMTDFFKIVMLSLIYILTEYSLFKQRLCEVILSIYLGDSCKGYENL